MGSVLAFILLVVLGGGIGLLAVSLADSSKPATVGSRRLRDQIADTSAPDPGAEPDPLPTPTATEVLIEAEAVPVPVPFVTAPEPAVDPAPVRRPDPRTVPSAYTALEGAFADVTRVPVWRRGLSLAGIVLITVAAGAGIATVAAAAIGAAAEVLDNAIG